jgi:hypothetical protein
VGIGFPDNELPGHFNKPCLKWPGEAPGHGVPVDAGGNEVAPPVLDEQFQWQIQKLQEWINRINVAAGGDAGKVKVDAADVLAFLEDQFTDKQAEAAKNDAEDLKISVCNDGGADNKLELYVHADADMGGADAHAAAKVQAVGHANGGAWGWYDKVLQFSTDPASPDNAVLDKALNETVTFEEVATDGVNMVNVDIVGGKIQLKHADTNSAVNSQTAYTPSSHRRFGTIRIDGAGHIDAAPLYSVPTVDSFTFGGDDDTALVSGGGTIKVTGDGSNIQTVHTGGTVQVNFTGTSTDIYCKATSSGTAGYLRDILLAVDEKVYDASTDVPVRWDVDSGTGDIRFFLDATDAQTGC